MEIYKPIISLFTSFFELSVALNFAYAASKQLRDTIKSGFLHNLQKLQKEYESASERLSNRLIILNEDPNIEKISEGVNQQSSKMLKDLTDEVELIKEKIDDAQLKVTNQIKPIYIFVAILGILILYLGGVESYFGNFPKMELTNILFVSTMYLIILYILSFTKKEVSSLFTSFFGVLIIIISFLFPYEIISTNNFDNFDIVNYSLVLSFFPLLFTIMRLFIMQTALSLKYQWKWYFHMKKLSKLEKELKSYQLSKDSLLK